VGNNSRLVYCILCIFLFGCNSNEVQKDDFIKINGYAQGTTYNIIYSDSLNRNFSISFDSILNNIDAQLSTYDSNSFISILNNSNDTCLSLKDNKLFEYCFNFSQILNKKTNGLFNPAIYPLVNYWGFYSNSNPVIDSLFIKDSILNYIDLQKNFKINSDFMSSYICKKSNKSKLDFNAVAQGYSVDLVSDFLKINEVKNFLVEIGGEISAKGFNSKNMPWRIGIEKPIDSSFVGQHEFQKIVELDNQSLATSGNYRKFKIINGKKFSHSINPVSGYPANNKLLSVSVICKKAAMADALSTSFMIMGKRNTIKFIKNNPSDSILCFMVYDSLNKFNEWSNF
jgi:thiamine biosynthesis lipoprotein